MKRICGALIFLSITFSCAPGKSPISPVNVHPVQPDLSLPKNPLPPQSPVLTSPAPVFDESILRGREFLFQKFRDVGQSKARDTLLGPLMTEPFSPLYQCCYKVMRSFLDKTQNTELYTPRWKKFLENNIKNELESYGPVSGFRLGMATESEPGEVSIPVLLQGKNGWAFLQFYFERRQDWFLSDIQGDWSSLKADKTSVSGSVFDPEEPLRP